MTKNRYAQAILETWGTQSILLYLCRSSKRIEIYTYLGQKII